MKTLALVTALLCGTAAFAADEFQLVPAAYCKPRGGLGNVLKKLQDGQAVNVAYLGGSITAQAGYRVQTLKWLQEQYPKAKLNEINAAIGGTGSDLGVYRVGQDVIQHQPDLVFVEFSVNDGGASPERIYKGMEGIVRQIWRANPVTDIVFVYTFRSGYEKDLDNGVCPRAASADENVADHYGIPSINMALKCAEMFKAGTMIIKPVKDQPVPEGVKVFSGDGVHPDPKVGHVVYTEVIADAIKAMKANAKLTPHDLVAPLDPGNWEQAKVVPLTPSMLSDGWREMKPEEDMAKRFAHFMPTLWTSGTPGETITFKFKGTAVKLYDLLGPNGGQAILTVDGVTQPHPRARFDSYCTYHRIATLGIGDGLKDEVHTVKVEISPDQPDRQPVAFRLKDPETELKGEKFQGTNLWVASIMMIGDLVE